MITTAQDFALRDALIAVRADLAERLGIDTNAIVLRFDNSQGALGWIITIRVEESRPLFEKIRRHVIDSYGTTMRDAVDNLMHSIRIIELHYRGTTDD